MHSIAMWRIFIFHLRFFSENRELVALEMESRTSHMKSLKLEEKVVALLHVFWDYVYHAKRPNKLVNENSEKWDYQF